MSGLPNVSLLTLMTLLCNPYVWGKAVYVCTREDPKIFIGNREIPTRITSNLLGASGFTGNPYDSCRETFAVYL